MELLCRAGVCAMLYVIIVSDGDRVAFRGHGRGEINERQRQGRALGSALYGVAFRNGEYDGLRVS